MSESCIDYNKGTPLRVYISSKKNIVALTKDLERHSTVCGYITKFWDGLENGAYGLFRMEYTFTVSIITKDMLIADDKTYDYIGICKSKADLVNLIPEYFV